MFMMTTKDNLDDYPHLPPDVEHAMLIAKLELIKDTGEVVENFEVLKTRWLDKWKKIID